MSVETPKKIKEEIRVLGRFFKKQEEAGNLTAHEQKT